MTPLRTFAAIAATILLPLVAFAADGTSDPAFARWLKPIAWQRDSETPALSLGEKGKFDDQHIFAPHVVFMDGEYWMYYSGSQR